jgi:hypothetical protein
MKIRRQHGRVRDDLPQELREQVDRLLIEPGNTYEDIKAFLAGQGHDISRSAIGRYGKDFLSVYQRLKQVEDKSKALVSAAGDGMVLEEAASKLFAQMILEGLMSAKIDVAKYPKILGEFARLQASTVLRERLKKDYSEKVKKTADAVTKAVKSKGLSDEAAEEIRKKILGITK